MEPHNRETRKGEFGVELEVSRFKIVAPEGRVPPRGESFKPAG